MIQEKNIATSIILTIVTCGIYGIYWFVTLTDDVNRVSGEENATSGGLAFLLTIVTCGIYGIYWAYTIGQKITKAKANCGLQADSNSGVLYLILEVLGLAIVVYALAQNDLNEIARREVTTK